MVLENYFSGPNLHEIMLRQHIFNDNYIRGFAFTQEYTREGHPYGCPDNLLCDRVEFNGDIMLCRNITGIFLHVDTGLRQHLSST